ncbi:MAG: helix-turn-helix domain-containing protein [Candidatus Peregrinibacteria bacterium]
MLALVEKIYTTEQVATLLQIHPLTVLKYIKMGLLRAARLGRVYRVTESSIQNFMDQATNR